MGSLARNPWVALDVTADPVAHARMLRRAHERGLAASGARPSEVRELVAKSWQRSLAAGVVPDSAGAPVRFGPDELAAAREDSPLAPVVGVIFSTLSGLDDDARHVVAIGDAEANLLWVTGEAGTCARAREIRFQEGAAWSESMAGTNAVGTAAALDHQSRSFPLSIWSPPCILGRAPQRRSMSQPPGS
jgi:transcriptional regulator of acetoin/glycerol metabolism